MLAIVLKYFFLLSVTPFEDYSAKCYRLRDDIQLLTNGQLILLTKLLVRHWDQTKIRDSGIVQVFILELDGVLRKKGDSFPEREQLTLALSMGAFHYLDGIRFPSKILNNILLNFKGENSGKEAIVLILLLASCCRRNTAKENCFTERAIIMEEKLLAIFEKLNHSELAVSFQGLQTLSDGSAGLKLKLLTEARHGFRM